ncbi:MAG: DNA-directed RNA polymerase subunit beta [bacterium]
MRKINFAKIDYKVEMPELLETQKNSFEDFLQAKVDPEKRKFQGLQAAFLDVFPIRNADESLTLEFIRYELGEPKYTVEDAIMRDVNYSLPVRAVFRLSQKQEGGKIKEIAEQEVYLTDMPIMTPTATFIINGAERVIVSQLHRSPGVIFEEDEEKKISSYGKGMYFARIIPYRGAWVEFEYDLNNCLYVRIDKKRKFLATVLLRAMGIETNDAILKLFYATESLNLSGMRFEQIEGKVLAEDVIEHSTGEVIYESNHEITKDTFGVLKEKKIQSIKVLQLDKSINDVTMRNTLQKDSIRTRKEAINLIYRILRAQEFITPDQAENYLEGLLFKTIRKYDLCKVGRYKINKKLDLFYDELMSKPGFKFERPSDRKRTLLPEDIIATIKYIILLNNGFATFKFKDKQCKVEIDDIDHLGNRRVRAVGELLENQIRVGLSQIARFARDKMNLQDKNILTPRSIINTAPLVGIIRKFYGTSQLSQFMDQTNPLAELTHKRRLSALGPGGLHRKRAGFEVRDVHHTHYGRICPIETPEGPNIGLITSLACFAQVNEYGLIESPFRVVKNGKVTDEIEYLTAEKEDEKIVAQANTKLDKNSYFDVDLAACRYFDDFPLVEPKDVNAMDVSPMQVISASTALIPFLEHDDANRALMGSNMQRQAVPLLITDAPLVSTGIEGRVAKDSGATVVAKRAGKVIEVTSDKISIWSDQPLTGKDAVKTSKKDSDISVDVYYLRKYTRSNQDTCINQIPIVNSGDSVKKGQVIADGPGTDNGELALGKNLLVAFMPWEGYNFEDAILLNERLVKDDVFTSIHIQEFQVEARDTKMGAEEITRDIPNVGAESLINLDEVGIVRIGADVTPGDILVGKVSPKGEQQVTPEERLLKVIFGKKSEDVQDASLKVPPGVTGKVLGVKVFIRREKLTKREERSKVKEIDDKYKELVDELRRELKSKISEIEINGAQKKQKKSQITGDIEDIKIIYDRRIDELKERQVKEKEDIHVGDELPVTVNKVVKVYIASRRKVQVGDKLAGRHGNKGVVAKIMSQENMPYLPDGTPVDVVLSPLSVPSRMNVGQLLEMMLGWAAHHLNIQMVTPVFDGAKESEILDMVRQAKDKLKKDGVPEDYLPSDDCKITLYDGRTGEPFSEKISIGYMYLLKLAHLVEDKIHARSTGPYSLITRQPLGGKAQFGGQRFGEMEVWAIEGYGASYTLQEFLTVKSDDVLGRTKIYEAIIKGETYTEPGVPESFKVLVKELQALGLNVALKSEKSDAVSIEKSKSAVKVAVGK